MYAISLTHAGDGSSMESAVRFEGCQNRAKHIVMQYLWLSKKGLESKKQIYRESKEGIKYDIHFTQAGPVWFAM